MINNNFASSELGQDLVCSLLSEQHVRQFQVLDILMSLKVSDLLISCILQVLNLLPNLSEWLECMGLLLFTDIYLVISNYAIPSLWTILELIPIQV